MNSTWQLQEAKSRLSELVETAARKGAQTITRHGREAAVVISVRDFGRLTRPKESLVSFLRNSPLAGADLDLGRTDDYGRKVEL